MIVCTESPPQGLNSDIHSSSQRLSPVYAFDVVAYQKNGDRERGSQGKVERSHYSLSRAHCALLAAVTDVFAASLKPRTLRMQAISNPAAAPSLPLSALPISRRYAGRTSLLPPTSHRCTDRTPLALREAPLNAHCDPSGMLQPLRRGIHTPTILAGRGSPQLLTRGPPSDPHPIVRGK